jgi:hypothetical protein
MNFSSKWIRVEDKLPSIGQEVLVSFRQGHIQFIFISYLNDEKEWSIGNLIFHNPSPDIPLIATHWVSLLD